MTPQALCARRGRGRRRAGLMSMRMTWHGKWRADPLLESLRQLLSRCCCCRHAAVEPRRWPTPWPMPAGQSASQREPSSSAATIACCLSLNLAALNRLAHRLLAHPSPCWKQARCAAVALARARPASTSAEQPVALHTYVADAAAARPCTTELGLLPLPQWTLKKLPLRFRNCAALCRSLRCAASAASSTASSLGCAAAAIWP